MRHTGGGPAGLLCGVLILLFQAVSPAATHAQDKGVVFAGAGDDDDRSIFAGVQYALPGARLGDGWAIRASAYGGRYDYTRDNHSVRGNYAGGEAGPAYQWSGAWGYVTIAALGRYVYTDLNPYDRDNPRRGDQASAAVTVDGARNWGPWRVSGYGEYGFRIDDYLVRANVTHRLSDHWRVGLESQAQGDHTYNRQHLGVLAAVKLDRRSELQFSVGDSRQNDRGARPYGAISLSRTF